jgi:hypothetical protein
MNRTPTIRTNKGERVSEATRMNRMPTRILIPVTKYHHCFARKMCNILFRLAGDIKTRMPIPRTIKPTIETIAAMD